MASALGGHRLAVTVAASSRGRTAALAATVRDAVRSGQLPAGTRLPSTRTLAADLGLSRGVVVRCYEQLTAEGFLVARSGAGTTVAPVRADAGRRAPATRRPLGNPGLPSGAEFPRAAWRRAADRAIEGVADADLGYGDPAGHPRLRTELLGYLGRVRGVTATPDQMLVVNGFGQATRLIADVLVAAGTGRVAVEDPGSAGMIDQLERAGCTCVSVPVDELGLDVEALERTDADAVIVTPAHQFPTGVVLAPERRHALLAWARAGARLVVEDDYDAELRYDRAPVGCLQGLGPDVVVHGGSVSKTLAPGIRLGWLVAPDPVVEVLRDAKYAADLCTSVIEQLTLAEFLASGELDRHVRRSTVLARRRRDALVAALATSLPGWRVSGAAAGLHVLLQPPEGADERALVAAARAVGLDARPLEGFARGPSFRAGLVVGYGQHSPRRLTLAIRDLAARVGDEAAGR